MNQIEVVNTVWKGVVCHNFRLHKLCLLAATLPMINKVTLQTVQPKQLIIKFFDNVTMLVFKTGKFRIIGKQLDYNKALGLSSCVTSLATLDSPILVLQTMTAVYTHTRPFNLAIVARHVQGAETKTMCHYDAEQ